MIKLATKKKCFGCTACYAACNKSAITMHTDTDGFKYPEIDKKKCIGCGACAKVCPILHPFESNIPIGAYAVMAKDKEIRRTSSSGGASFVLASHIIKNGGVVFGAAFDKRDWSVVHKSAATITELVGFKGSKYVQSDLGDSYREVKRCLDSGKLVMFVGTPCQVAGLNHFVQHDNLLTIDLICHAAPSPLAWKKYITEISAGDIVDAISFRDKKFGWREYVLSVSLPNKAVIVRQCNNPYLRAFFSELCNRPSCHQGECRGFKSGSDITLSDFWRVKDVLPELDDSLGISSLFIHTPKGERFFREAQNDFTERSVVPRDAWQARIDSAPPESPKRSYFMRRLKSDNVNFELLVSQALRPAFFSRVTAKLKRVRTRFLNGSKFIEKKG